MNHILFVCTGNTCRSPMAEAYLKNLALPGVEVRSAGIYAMDGSPASTNAKIVLDGEGIPHNHQSTLLTNKEVGWATYILTMTMAHKEAVIRNFPEAETKTYTVKEFAELDGRQDIADPFGGPVQIYKATYDELTTAIEKIAKKLQQ